MKYIPRPSVLSAAALALIVGLLAGFYAPRDDSFFALKKNFTIFGKLYEELAAGYVDPVDPEMLMRTGIDAMLQSLDPYTVFIDEADNQDIEIITRGRYGGVGLSIGERGGRVVVVSPIEGYSGYEQGVRTGDVLARIAGVLTDDMDVSDVRNLLRGEPGTTVDVEVMRTGQDRPLGFTLTRTEIQLKNVTYSGFVGDPAQGVGYVRLERFAREAGPEVALTIEQLRQSGTLRALVLDLRGNPGGLLEAAVDVAGHFLPENSVIVSTRGRLPQTERVYRTRSAPVLPDLPLAVLVDGGSASASEIVAGAIQDHDRGIVIGETTFGKGLVQVIRPLPYNTSLKMTTSKYYTPSGRSIQAVSYERDGTGGRAVQIADSLRRAYTTFGGRPVFDGHGIEPDVHAGHGEMSELEEALLRKSAFFLFANEYAAGNPAPADGFRVDERLLAEFRQWVERQDFSYATRAEQMLDALSEDLDDAGYSGAAGEVDALRRRITTEKNADFQRHSASLKHRLRTEILARYLGETSQIRASLEDDAALERAMATLASAPTYGQILKASR
jgi:carboxyl-terminal processing protease